MSGVYIGGVEMPKSKPICIIIDPAGQVRHYDLNNDKYADDELFEAVNVPPHGDLVDRDEMRAIAISLLNEAVTDQEADAIREMWSRLGQMPVYIPAEEGKV